jgi:hypothetical protein
LSEDKEKAGLGEVVYSVDDETAESPKEEKEAREAKRAERAEVEEAEAESFPASDPPSFAGGKATDE